MPPAAARHLPPLPVRLHGRPFGLEDDGRPIKGVTGASFELTLNYLRQCVGQRAAAELPAGATTQERAHAIARAQSEALDELVARLNTAIADPRYQVTLDTLQRKGHRFSFEFSAYLAAVSAELSGDPRFYFHRLAASAQAGPKPFYILLRALPLGQAYRFFPSLVARLADTRLEVVEIKETSAVVRWHAKPHKAQVPAALWPHFVEDTRGGLQGTLAILPTIHSNLPAAEVTERVSCLDGNPYDEWVFTWQAPQARGWFESRRAAAPDPPPAPETQFLPRPPLPALPARLQAPAFGRRPADPAARGINRYDLNRILAHLVKCVRGRAEQALPAGLPAAERDRRLAQPGLALLRELGVPFDELDADAARRIEPALHPHTALAGAIHLPQDEVGNCRQFAIILRDAAEQLGARFAFNTTVTAIDKTQPATFHVAHSAVPHRFDALVLCAGVGSAELLRPLGLRLPLAPGVRLHHQRPDPRTRCGRRAAA